MATTPAPPPASSPTPGIRPCDPGPQTDTKPARAIGYVRTSTDEQLAGLDPQEVSIRNLAAARGWHLIDVVREQAPGADDNRPGLTSALRRVRRRGPGSADVLIVAKLDRLTRSLAHPAGLLDDARANDWTLVTIDVGVDLSTPTGEQRPFPHRRLCCPLGSSSTTAASDAHPASHPLPGFTGYRTPRSDNTTTTQTALRN